MKIRDLQINHLTTPLGFALDGPQLSWRYDGLENGDGTHVDRARITVARTREALIADQSDDLLLDSGWRDDLDPQATPLNLGLDWRERYWWRVQVRTNAGRVISSDPTWFETGVMEDEWIAEWITTGHEDLLESRHPIFSRRLSLKQSTGNIDCARIYACGLGLMRVFVDGTPLDAQQGQGRLDPGDFADDAWLQTMTYDVTSSLKTAHSSRPRVSILLGNGWYRGRVLTGEAADPHEKPWDVIAEVHLWYKDGTHQVIGTNSEWEVTRSHITSSSIYDGETRDDTLPDSAPVPAVVNQHNHALLYDRMSPAISVYESMPVKADHTTPTGERLFDLGQNFAGVFRFHNTLPRGARIVFHFGEHVENGELDRRNLRTAQQRYEYVSDGSSRDIEPLFTYYGYRYVSVCAQASDDTDLTASLSPRNFTDLTASLSPRNFTGLAFSTSLEQIGTIRTGNAKINRLIANTRWSERSNFMDTPTDCPQRDERLGWTGDAQVFAPTALYFTNAAAFYRKYLFDMRAEQERQNGMVPVIIPARGDQFSHVSSAAWSDAATIVPWDVYRFTGDSTILAASYPLMKDWVHWVEKTDAKGDHAWREHFHFGDWLALDGEPGAKGVRGATPIGLIADAYWYRSASIVAKAARLLHNESDEGEFAALAQRIRARLARDYYTADGVCTAGTQTGYILSLAFGLGDAQANAQKLHEQLVADDGRLKTGFVGTSLLVQALANARNQMPTNPATPHGESPLSVDFLNLLFDERYPGWLAAVNLGATTIWERWNSLLPDGRLRFDETDPLGNMNSLNHYWLGCVCEWFFRNGAGLTQNEEFAGFRTITCAPEVSRRLGELDVRYKAPAGTWHVAWKIGDGKAGADASVSADSSRHIHLEITVPFDATADLVLPCTEDQPHHLGPGKHVYDYEVTSPIPR